MAILTPTWTQNGAYNARTDRLAIKSIVPTAGVTMPLSMKPVPQSSPNMTIKLLAGSAFVDGIDRADQGIYHVYFEDDQSSPAIAAAGSGQTRRDLVYIAVNDPTATGPNGDNAQVLVSTGTPVSVGNTPAVTYPTSSYLPIAEVTVLNSTTSLTASEIQDVRVLCGGLDHVGTLQMWMADTLLPGGWALCNGDLYDIVDVPEYAELVSNRFGGDGSSTVGVPDFQGRFPVGTGGGYDLDSSGGLASVALADDHLAGHTHYNTHSHGAYSNGAGAHSHSIPNGFITGAVGIGAGYTGTTYGYSYSANTYGVDNHTHGVGVYNYTGHTGTVVESHGAAHENRPPYQGAHMIIRVS